MNRAWCATWLGVALLAAAASPASAQPDLSDWKIERTRTSKAAAVAALVRISNPWGNVTLRAGDGDQIVVSTVSQRHREDPRTPQVDIEQIASGFSVEVRFNPVEVEDAAWQARRIDLGVFVPATISVSIRTADSDIKVRDLQAPADLETTAGNIEFRGGGGLRARADSGSIYAQFRGSDWPRPVTLETRTGDIRAELLEGASATAEIETRGPITSDYSITIDRAAGSRLKRGVAKVGAGGQTLRLVSYSGAVRLLAVIVPERDQPQG